MNEIDNRCILKCPCCEEVFVLDRDSFQEFCNHYYGHVDKSDNYKEQLKKQQQYYENIVYNNKLLLNTKIQEINELKDKLEKCNNT